MDHTKLLELIEAKATGGLCQFTLSGKHAFLKDIQQLALTAMTAPDEVTQPMTKTLNNNVVTHGAIETLEITVGPNGEETVHQFAWYPPQALHPLTAALVMRFSLALAQKLTLAQEKHGYSDRWADHGNCADHRAELYMHLMKGDPLDVAAYCAFLWHHGESTSPARGVDPNQPLVTP